MNRIYIFPINSRSYPNFIPRLCNFCCIINMTKRHLFCTITIMTSIYIVFRRLEVAGYDYIVLHNIQI